MELTLFLNSAMVSLENITYGYFIFKFVIKEEMVFPTIYKVDLCKKNAFLLNGFILYQVLNHVFI